MRYLSLFSGIEAATVAWQGHRTLAMVDVYDRKIEVVEATE